MFCEQKKMEKDHDSEDIHSLSSDFDPFKCSDDEKDADYVNEPEKRKKKTLLRKKRDIQISQSNSNEKIIVPTSANNHNDFFANLTTTKTLSNESTVLVETNSNPEENKLENTISFDLEARMESMLTKFSEKIENRFERIQKQLARLEAKMNCMKPFDESTKCERLGEQDDFHETLRLIGLPLKTVTDMADFENNLQIVSFEQKLVINIMHLNNMYMISLLSQY